MKLVKLMSLIECISGFFKVNSSVEPRMYIIVRRDLSETYRMVQGSHALAEYALKFPNQFKQWNNGYLIFLSVFNLNALRDLNISLCGKGVDFTTFCEPDLDNQETAIAIFDTGKLVKGLPLA
jgi:hypothetical protein